MSTALTTSAERTYKRHLAAIDAHEVTRTNVIGLRKALSNDYRRQAGWSHNAGMMSSDQCSHLVARVAQEAPKVADDFQAFGLAYLRKPRNYAKLPHHARLVLDAGMCQIHLVDFFADNRGVHRPVYRVESMKRDNHFCYTVTPWQAGGDGLEVVNL